MQRIAVLDGWRATSILLVMACHMIWLGPAAWQLNFVAGAAGMALFFTLSGFLIVSFLHNGAPLGQFMLKRAVRIVPLCWVTLAIIAMWQPYDAGTIARNLLFVANLPPAALMEGGHHLWSLGVEMQFYALAALLCLPGRKALFLIPFLAIAVTAARVISSEPISIVTWHRVDEILAGGTLALIHARGLKVKAPLPLLALGLLLSSHPAMGPLQYLRPYFAAMLVGVSLHQAPAWLENVLASRPMGYVAEISYALYVIHGVLIATWLGSGRGLEKYLLDLPLLLAATFALAHCSTRYFEQPIMRAIRQKRRLAAAST